MSGRVVNILLSLLIVSCVNGSSFDTQLLRLGVLRNPDFCCREHGSLLIGRRTLWFVRIPDKSLRCWHAGHLRQLRGFLWSQWNDTAGSWQFACANSTTSLGHFNLWHWLDTWLRCLLLSFKRAWHLWDSLKHWRAIHNFFNQLMLFSFEKHLRVF